MYNIIYNLFDIVLEADAKTHRWNIFEGLKSKGP